MLDNHPKLKILFKAFLFVGAFASFFCIALYFFQNKMLYMPGMPYRHIADNPIRFNSPLDRQMKFKDVEITTVDNLKIRG
jgi:hypothetical protein